MFAALHSMPCAEHLKISYFLSWGLKHFEFFNVLIFYVCIKVLHPRVCISETFFPPPFFLFFFFLLLEMPSWIWHEFNNMQRQQKEKNNNDPCLVTAEWGGQRLGKDCSFLFYLFLSFFLLGKIKCWLASGNTGRLRVSDVFWWLSPSFRPDERRIHEFWNEQDTSLFSSLVVWFSMTKWGTDHQISARVSQHSQWKQSSQLWNQVLSPFTVT